MIKSYSLLTFYFIFYSVLAFTQNHIFDITKIDEHDGLLHREVRAVFEDNNGFIWLGSERGLQKYDGYNFKNWTKASPSGLLYYITAISQDDAGWLWLYNENDQTFVFLNPLTEEIQTIQQRFGEASPFKTNLDGSCNWLSKRGLIRNEKGQLFFALTDGQFFSFDAKNGFTKLQIGLKYSATFLSASDHYYWLEISNLNNAPVNMRGIYRFDIDSKTLKYFKTNRLIIFKDFDDYIIYSDSKNDIEDRDIQYYKIDQDFNVSKLPLDNNLDYEIPHKLLWSQISPGTWHIYNEELSEVVDSFTSEYLNKKLATGFFRFYTDSRDIIWVFGRLGLRKITMTPSKFKTFFSYETENSKPFSNSVRGITIVDQQIYTNFEVSKSIKVNKNNPEDWSILDDAKWNRPILNVDNDIYVGYSVNIKQFNRSGELIKTYQDENAEFYNIWAIHKDNFDNFWVGDGINLYKLAPKDSLFRKYVSDQQDYGFQSRRGAIQNIIPFKDNLLWFCSWTGLYLFDAENEIILNRFSLDEEGENYIPAEIIYYIYQDKNDVFWLGTNAGLIRWSGPCLDQNNTYNRKLKEEINECNPSIKRFTRSDGLPNDIIYAIYEDDYNRLWMSSDYGIISFDKETYDIQNYLPKDGTSHYEFNRTSQFREEDGTIYFGSLNGITSFNPNDFKSKEDEHVKMNISSFEVFDGDEGQLINKIAQVNKTHSIDFRPQDKYLNLSFVLPTFEDNSKNLYAYKIEGFNDDWTYVKTNSLQIGFLPYGEHILRVKGQSSNGGWSPHELAISLNVIKPFYLQAWFILSVLFAFLFMLYSFFKYRTRLLEVEISKATKQIVKDKEIIENQTKELQKLDKLKSRFFANVSHELRTPLSLMLGPVKYLLKENTGNNKNTKLLSFIKNNTQHLSKLVDEILDLSKLENDKMELNEEPVNLYSYLKNHMNQFYSFGTSEEVNFESKFIIDKALVVLIDKNKVEKIINNFISNAIKFTPKNGHVRFETLIRHDSIIMSICDDGKGIHEDDLPYIFERFYQSRIESQQEEGGTGIGLSMCYELSNLMGGEVWVENNTHRGCTFYFSCPLKIAEIEIQQINVVNPQEITNLDLSDNKVLPSSHNKKYTILIAEDNYELREYYRIILDDYKIIDKTNGREALEYLQSESDLPDLIISDLMMPIMNGIEFLSHLKSDSRFMPIPVIMLTAKTNSSVKLKAIRIGIDDYITKPFDEEELKVRIFNILNRQIFRKQFIENEIIVEASAPVYSKEELEWLEEIENFINNNIESGLISVSFLANNFKLSESSLLRQIKKITGLTPKKYILEIKLNLARTLLENKTYKTIAQVAYKSGFKNANNFSTTFKNRYGKSPSSLL